MYRIILVGCGKAKVKHAAPAADLYVGPLFTARRAYAKLAADAWYILSAKYGLVPPYMQLRPYDLALSALTAVDLAAWHVDCARGLLDDLRGGVQPVECLVELHAGADYADMLAEILTTIGMTVEKPLASLRIGQQLAWYKRHTFFPAPLLKGA